MVASSPTIETTATAPTAPPVDAVTGSPDEIRAELIARARSLVPTLKQRALLTEQQRFVPAETVEDLRRLGLLRVATPAEWGGYAGIDYDTMCEVAYELAQGCSATGWCYSNWMSHNWMAGMIGPAAQADYFSQGPDILSGTASPSVVNRVKVTDEGYRITGKWTYSSGSKYSQFFFCGIDAVVSAALIPLADITVHDTWNPPGLAGTSTNSVSCTDALVPFTHMWTPLDGNLLTGPPGWKRHGRASYRLAMWMFTYTTLAPIIGMARGAIDDFKNTYAGTTGTGRTGSTESLQILFAESAAEIDVAERLWRGDIAAVLAKAGNDETFDIEERATVRRDQAYAAKLVVRAVTRLFEATGASSLTRDNQLQRAFRDVHASLHHVTLPWEVTMADYGRVAFDQPFVMEFQRDGIDPTLVARPPAPGA